MARAATMRKERAYAPAPDFPGGAGPGPGGARSDGDSWKSVRNFVFACLAVVVCGLGFIAWLMSTSGPTGEAPLIEAENTPYKTRYEGAPKAVSKSPSLDQALVDETLVIEDVTARPKPEAPINAPTKRAAAAPKEDAKKTAPSFAADGAFLAQIASLRSREAAEAAWTRITGKESALFASAKLDIESVDLAEKGVYHRVRAGYFLNRGTANAFCERVRANGHECLVVTR